MKGSLIIKRQAAEAPVAFNHVGWAPRKLINDSAGTR